MAQSTVPIITLVDKQEEQFFPVTHVDAVIDSNGNPVSALLAGKQPTLVSGSNIKSINNESLLGSGNITISGGSGDVFVATYGVTTGTEIANAVSQNKLVVVKYGDIMYTLVNGWHSADVYSFEAFFNNQYTDNFTRSVIYAEDGNSASWQGPTDSVAYPLLFQGSWNQIRLTRNDGGLIPGAWYRITDYVATLPSGYVNGENVAAESANHPFDILLLATSTNTFSEEAKAMPHYGDTYFANTSGRYANLNAWKIWYCLDNDANRFDWADSTNGKGVIYRMIDEFNNDCPYDFKGIVFRKGYTWAIENRASGLGWLADCSAGNISASQSLVFYTFSLSFNDIFYEFYDASVYQIQNDGSFAYGVHDNYIAPNYEYHRGDNGPKRQTLNGHLFVENNRNEREEGYVDGFKYNKIAGDCYNNYFAEGCWNISIAEWCSYNWFGAQCRRIKLSEGCCVNQFQYGSRDITLGTECQFNYFNSMWSDSYVRFESLSDCCKNIVLGNGVREGYIHYCTNVIIGNETAYYRIGNGMDNVTVGENCEHVYVDGWLGYNLKMGNNLRYVRVFGGTTGCPQNLIVIDNLHGTAGQWMDTGTFTHQGTDMWIMGPISGSPGFVIRKFDVTVFPTT